MHATPYSAVRLVLAMVAAAAAVVVVAVAEAATTPKPKTSATTPHPRPPECMPISSTSSCAPFSFVSAQMSGASDQKVAVPLFINTTALTIRYIRILESLASIIEDTLKNQTMKNEGTKASLTMQTLHNDKDSTGNQTLKNQTGKSDKQNNGTNVAGSNNSQDMLAYVSSDGTPASGTDADDDNTKDTRIKDNLENLALRRRWRHARRSTESGAVGHLGNGSMPGAAGYLKMTPNAWDSVIWALTVGAPAKVGGGSFMNDKAADMYAAWVALVDPSLAPMRVGGGGGGGCSSNIGVTYEPVMYHRSVLCAHDIFVESRGCNEVVGMGGSEVNYISGKSKDADKEGGAESTGGTENDENEEAEKGANEKKKVKKNKETADGDDSDDKEVAPVDPKPAAPPRPPPPPPPTSKPGEVPSLDPDLLSVSSRGNPTLLSVSPPLCASVCGAMSNSIYTAYVASSALCSDNGSAAKAAAQRQREAAAFCLGAVEAMHAVMNGWNVDRLSEWGGVGGRYCSMGFDSDLTSCGFTGNLDLAQDYCSNTSSSSSSASTACCGYLAESTRQPPLQPPTKSSHTHTRAHNKPSPLLFSILGHSTAANNEAPLQQRQRLSKVVSFEWEPVFDYNAAVRAAKVLRTGDEEGDDDDEEGVNVMSPLPMVSLDSEFEFDATAYYAVAGAAAAAAATDPSTADEDWMPGLGGGMQVLPEKSRKSIAAVALFDGGFDRAAAVGGKSHVNGFRNSGHGAAKENSGIAAAMAALLNTDNLLGMRAASVDAQVGFTAGSNVAALKSQDRMSKAQKAAAEWPRQWLSRFETPNPGDSDDGDDSSKSEMTEEDADSTSKSGNTTKGTKRKKISPTPPNSKATQNSASSGGGLSVGVIVGISVGAAALLFTIVAIFVVRFVRRQQREPPESSGTASSFIPSSPSLRAARRKSTKKGKEGSETLPQTKKTVHQYEPTQQDEIALNPGDFVEIALSYQDGWATGKNLTTGRIGTFPLACLEGWPLQHYSQLSQTAPCRHAHNHPHS